MAAPKKIDYERIEPDWRAGIKSPAQMAAEYTEETGVSVSHAAIIKHFRKLGVPRDLTAKVQAKAESMVMQAMVTGKVTAETTVKDSVIIARGAEDVANVRITHRQDINKARGLVMAMFDELGAEMGVLPDLLELGEVMRRPDKNGVDKLNDLYNKIISLPGRVDSGKKLTEALKNLIGLEREAYGLSVEKEGESQPGGKFYRSSQVLTDAERAVRLHALLNKQPGADAK